jgi:hypothetical protein
MCHLLLLTCILAVVAKKLISTSLPWYYHVQGYYSNIIHDDGLSQWPPNFTLLLDLGMLSVGAVQPLFMDNTPSTDALLMPADCRI